MVLLDGSFKDGVSSSNLHKSWTDNMAHLDKGAAKPDSVFGTHMVEAENQLLKVVFWPSHMCYGMFGLTPHLIKAIIIIHIHVISKLHKICPKLSVLTLLCTYCYSVILMFPFFHFVDRQWWLFIHELFTQLFKISNFRPRYTRLNRLGRRMIAL